MGGAQRIGRRNGGAATRRALRALALVLFILDPSSLSHCMAGSVRTLDGRTLEGDVKLEQGGQIVVTPAAAGAKPEKVDLADVLHASFRSDLATKPAAPVTPRVKEGQLPPPWQATDIGVVAKAAVKYTNEGEVYSLRSAGGKLGADTDAFCFVAQSASGDADLVAKVIDAGSPDKVAQGLMFRAGPDADAAHVAVVVRGNALRLIKRARANAGSETVPVGGPVTFPVWLRLARRANTVTASVSRDGSRWDQLAGGEIPANAPGVLAGAVCCGTSKEPLGGHVSNLRLTATGAAAAGSSAATTVVPLSYKEGLMFRSGTLLAGAQIERAEDGSIRYAKGDRRETVSASNVARIIFRELTPEQSAKIPEKGVGVLTKEGDFVEGELKGLQGGQVHLSSVLFGLASYPMREKALALALNDLDPARPEVVVRTQDGSTYAGKTIKPDKDRLLIEDPVAGSFAVYRGEVLEISAGAARLLPLGSLKPQKVEPAPARDGGAGLSVDATGVGLPLTLGGSTFERGVALPAGSAATWDFAGGGYRALTFKCGVPRGVLPTAPVRFVVLADGKELFRSKPRTSADEPLAASVSLKGIKSLTLKVESTAGEHLPTPGVWADAALVK